MPHQSLRQLFPLGLFLLLALLLALLLGQTDTALGSGLMQSPLAPPTLIEPAATASPPVLLEPLPPLADAPLEAGEGGIPLGKIPYYRGYMPLIFKNAW
jgi:hypothetical protein